MCVSECLSVSPSPLSLFTTTTTTVWRSANAGSLRETRRSDRDKEVRELNITRVEECVCVCNINLVTNGIERAQCVC